MKSPNPKKLSALEPDTVIQALKEIA